MAGDPRKVKPQRERQSVLGGATPQQPPTLADSAMRVLSKARQQEALEEAPAPSQADAIVPAANGSFAYKRFVVTPVGLQIPDEVSQDEWKDVGDVIKKLDSAIGWAAGDWAAYANATWGLSYQAIAQEFGYEVETLWTYASIARAVKTLIRNQGLSFAHHRLVARLEDDRQKREWLAAAEMEGWTVKQMKAAMGKGSGAPLPALKVFERAGRSFWNKIESVMGNASKEDRQEMAARLRSLADQIEQQ